MKLSELSRILKFLTREDVIESYNEKRHKLERNILHFTFFKNHQN